MATGLPAPVHLMRATFRALPPPALSPLLAAAMAMMQRRHAPLLRRLMRLAPASILFELDDVPHRFLLVIAGHGIRLRLAHAGSPPATVTMKAGLATLLGLLEGRIDSDTVFFTRDLAVSGDTAVAVAFRNTLDGEAINLTDDILALLGPLAPAAERFARGIDARLQRGRTALAGLHGELHGRHDFADERRRFLAEIEALKARLTRLETRGRRAGEAAA
jgi:predicted lipid carrier protein YhbT